MENKKKYPFYTKNNNNLSKSNHNVFKIMKDELTSSSSTTNINRIIKDNSTNNYYQNYKNPNNNFVTIQQIRTKKQINQNNKGIPNISIYSKEKITKTIGNVNNIIINNNTNIINNNNTNIINNNFINDKDYSQSVNELNLQQINELNKTNQIINNNKIREKPIINRKIINHKKFIHVKNKDSVNINMNNKKLMIMNNLTNEKSLEKKINNNNDMIEQKDNTIKNDENSIIFNVEELLMIEEKLSSLIKCLLDCNPCTEECFEFLNFYFTTKLCKNFNKYFININVLQIIKKTMNIFLFSFILCYDISLHEDILPQYIDNLNKLFNYIYAILILISKYFCNKIIASSNIYVNKLHNLINKSTPKKKTGK